MCAKGLMSAVHVCLCSRSAVSLSTFGSGTCRGRLRSAAAVQRGDLGNTQMSTETSAAVRDAVFIGGADLLPRNAARPEKTPEHIYLQARARAPPSRIPRPPSVTIYDHCRRNHSFPAYILYSR